MTASYDRNLEHLHGDDLTWALHRQNRADVQVIKARITLVLWAIGILSAVFTVLVFKGGG